MKRHRRHDKTSSETTLPRRHPAVRDEADIETYYILLPRERLNATKDKCYTHNVNDSISRQTKNPAVISYASFKRSVRALFRKRKAPCPIEKLRSAERTSQLFFLGRLKDGSPRHRICPFRSAAPGDDRTHPPPLGGLHAPLKPGG